MIIKWDREGRSGDRHTVQTEQTCKRAAQYVRMSTEHQQYSTDNQAEAIAKYAEARGYIIVKTYADDGKSGLNIAGRNALQLLLQDIQSGAADFEAVLVYDVSRWGRFQDPDEAASYELSCRRAGVVVHYCAEQFENDGSIGSSIIKTVKRAMAGEYSRELSVKVFAGQANLIRLGFRQGGQAGFGLRRVLVNQEGERKGELATGEHKSIQTDRVLLEPGPEPEQAIVREIFSRFVAGETENEIASDLNRRDVRSEGGRNWTRAIIHHMLINEKYVGHNVWGRTSFKLKQAHRQISPDEWIRCDNAFSPVIEQSKFNAAKAIIEARSASWSDDAMLDQLRVILAGNGSLTGLIIDEYDDSPSSGCYRSRFGSLLRAYALVGFKPDHDYRYIQINRSLNAMYPQILESCMTGLRRRGNRVDENDAESILTLNNQVRLSVSIARCMQTGAGSLRWKLRLDNRAAVDLTLLIRMDAANVQALDYYVIPKIAIADAILTLCEHNGLGLDAYRRKTLDLCFDVFRRTALEKAA
tara:strand:- start:9637 stop:11220 length:1584 start_codon:yes stop_codon:yes gene_type:complete